MLAYIWGVFTFKGAGEAIEREVDKKKFKPATFRGRIPLADREYEFSGEMFNEHYYSTSSLRSLSNTVRMFIVGHFFFERDKVQVFPYIMGEFEEQVGFKPINWSNTLRIYPDAFDAFRGMRTVEKVSKRDLDALAAIPEAQVKEILADLIGEPFVGRDWGGEKSDLSTNRLLVDGRPMSAAFILKGPSLKGEMHPKNMGKRGDQLVRAFDEPVELVVVQHCNKIANTVVRQAEALAYNPRGPQRYSIIDGADTVRILKAYGRLRP
ncbi:hypothetical protein ACLMJV_00025 [Sinorhizobium meliloti]|uniref:hypothetical protein n=1 Tax=Rhizobium meliloti TaxID=382 RepID=UPI00398CB93C